MSGRRRSQRLAVGSQQTATTQSTSTPKVRGGGAGKRAAQSVQGKDVSDEYMHDVLLPSPSVSMIAPADTPATRRSARASTRNASLATASVLRSRNSAQTKPGSAAPAASGAASKRKTSSAKQHGQQKRKQTQNPKGRKAQAARANEHLQDEGEEDDVLNMTDDLLSESPAPRSRQARRANNRSGGNTNSNKTRSKASEAAAASKQTPVSSSTAGDGAGDEEGAEDDDDILCASPVKQQPARQTRQANKTAATATIADAPSAGVAKGSSVSTKKGSKKAATIAEKSAQQRGKKKGEEKQKQENKQAAETKSSKDVSIPESTAEATTSVAVNPATGNVLKTSTMAAEPTVGVDTTTTTDDEAGDRSRAKKAGARASVTVNKQDARKAKAALKKHKEQLQAAVASAPALIALHTQHTDRSDPFDMCDALTSMPRAQQGRLWSALRTTLWPLFDRYVDGDLIAQKKTEDLEQGAADALRVFAATAVLLTAAVAEDKPHTTDDTLQCARILHESLFSLPTGSDSLRDQIVKVCEAWWFADLPGRDLLVPLTVSQLLVRALVVDAKSAAVKRVFAIRDAFELIDLSGDSSESLRGLLLQAFVNPNFVTLLEGQRFLSFIFGLNTEFIGAIWAAVKDTLPHCSSRLLDGYGQILYRAWRNSAAAAHARIERDCIQDLMVCAVHARRQAALPRRSAFHVAFALLDVFHTNKKERGVDEMLTRLYDPIIWRSTQVANAIVRANAASLLFAAFPLQDPQALRQEREELLQKQFEVCGRFLEDSSPLVRRIGVEGVCRILSTYWELIPAQTTSTLLGKLIKDLARDKASPDVRVSVFKGLSFILDNPLSRMTMKGLLPHVSASLHDTSRRVRAAFLDMLIAIRPIKNIRFFDVVSVDHLLARLELEDATNATKIVQLLASSFFPLGAAGDEERITRCIELQRNYPLACRHFFMLLLHTDVAVTDAARFIVILANYIVHADSGADEENADVLLDTFEQDGDAERVSDDEKRQLVEVVAILLKAIDEHRSRHKSILRKLGKALVPFVEHLHEVYEGDAVMHDLALLIAATAPAPPKRSEVLARAEEMASLPEQFLPSQAAHYVDWLCACDQLPAVIHMCEHWLTNALGVKHKPKFVAGPKSKGRKGTKAPVLSARDLNAFEKHSNKAALAVFAFRHILEKYAARFASVSDAFSSVRKLLYTAVAQASASVGSVDAHVLADALSLALEVEILAAQLPSNASCADDNGDDGVNTAAMWSMLTQQLRFVTESLLPLYADSSAQAKKKRHKSTISRDDCELITQTVLRGAVVCVRVEPPAPDVAQLLAKTLSAVVTAGIGAALSDVVGQLVAHFATAAGKLEAHAQDASHLARVEAMFDSLFALGPGHESLVADTFLFVFKALRGKFEGVIGAMARRACTTMLQHKKQSSDIDASPTPPAQQTLKIVKKNGALVRQFASQLPPPDADDDTAFVSLQLLNQLVDGVSDLRSRDQHMTAAMLQSHIHRTFTPPAQEKEAEEDEGETKKWGERVLDGAAAVLKRLDEMQSQVLTSA
ncbi:hypothetical protein PTSG_04158 [Salpingoeca rosetta]|uniref:Uncharacterized protein n=1 Tax=Salpingoeca rosetta (strain ATCC 50818 / BSB-021) TaxID=946362 RepID=F2U6S1_SALR5|nr:uncharacterized protein PTSG_04158 [Salpingoeca rosetta]EGD83553.1 hypothetical protein PTSG_04158 [Salpingoeca rosetta]|eukprot:XP_004995057.1 hypothetical protein PTSG_04158 [Salpingoeca rosetta]